MLLEQKNAVIYGGGGPVGSAVARAFAREGARVFLAGRTQPALDAAAQDIAAAGGSAETARVDALDEPAVERHLKDVARQAGRIDILFNATSMEDVQGIPFVDLPVDQFTHPIDRAVRTHFITSRAAARHMIGQRAGVIMTITATPARMAFPDCGGFGVACAAIEGFCRCLAAEVGPHGVRVVCLRSAGSPDSPGMMRATIDHAKEAGQPIEEFLKFLESQTLLRRLPSLADIGNTAALMASDRANAVTAAVTNLTCGAIAD